MPAVSESADAVVLDETMSPKGALELVAYKEGGVAWVGVRRKGSPVKEAIGLHTGSNKEHYLEVTAGLEGTWGVAFGAVSPEVDHVAVRNELAELFEGRILPLPPSFDEEYRAAWGVAARCREVCSLVGYDEGGRPIDVSMLRPRRRDLTANEVLEVIRTHCDHELRYSTWALKRMPSIPQQAPHVREVEHSRHILAQILAYVEGADDDRIAASSINAIIQRYMDMVEAESWSPPLANAPKGEVAGY